MLRWLRDEIWSTPEVLGKIMGLTARQGVYQTLAKMERDGYLASADITIFKKSTQRIVGITAHGLAFAFDADEPFEKRPTFEPSKVKLSTLQHESDIQLLRVQAERAGWKNWTPGARLGASQAGNRPDAIVLDLQMRVVAVEVERTIKTTKRYENILSQYLQAIAKGEYGRIAWVCPTEDLLAARLRRIVSSISSVPINGKRIALSLDTMS